MKTPTPGDSDLSVVPSEDINRVVNQWRQVFDPNYDVLPPHISLLYPLAAGSKEWPLVRSALVDCLRAFPPFSITLRRLGTFVGSPNILWLQPEDGGDLLHIRTALLARLPNFNSAQPDGYIPHLTVGTFESLEALAQAREAIATRIQPLRFRVNELIYMVVDEAGIGRVRDRFPLGGRPPVHNKELQI